MSVPKLAKHTPGPWKVEIETRRKFNSDTGQPLPEQNSVWIKAGPNFISLLCQPSEPNANPEPNANLIAAAPDMFDILKFLLADCVQKQELTYADGTPYEVDKIVAYANLVEDIRKLINRVEGGER